MSEALLTVENLTKHFPIYKGVFRRQVGTVKAVDGISFEIKRGETLGLVGESGCGKSTLGRVVAGILPPSNGQVRIGDAPVMEGGRKVTTRVQTVFQDPFASLDPRMKVDSIITEPMRAIQSATTLAAESLGWEGQVGAIAPGYFADIIAVQGNPLTAVAWLALLPNLYTMVS